jgi:hypothetical protein
VTGDYAATTNSWNPNWLTSPSPYNNQIVITATQALCGSTVAILASELWSAYVPYTACWPYLERKIHVYI